MRVCNVCRCYPCCCNICNPCCRPLVRRHCCNPCCNCCFYCKPPTSPTCRTSCYTLWPTMPKKAYCNSIPVCLDDCEPPTCMLRCYSCSPCPPTKNCCTPSCSPNPSCCGCFKDPCCCIKTRCGLSPPPIPRETLNYYNRNHKRPEEKCCCSPKNCCDPCCPPKNCCDSYCPPLKGPCDPCCSSAPPCVPYCPPCRKPICYPPVKCCEDKCEIPRERICYTPCPLPKQPDFCTCGMPNPCDCNLMERRRIAKCLNSPCCRRCGAKVFAAEKIMASGGAFHTGCFTCYCCNKALEVTTVFENQGEIYCKNCYAKFFGIQGYGFGATLQSI